MRDALRSDAPLVVVEAPAGCGKTHQAAAYTSDLASTGSVGRILVLTHTHAACSVFSERALGAGNRIEIRTIDSVIVGIASIYHTGLGLPSDVAAWARLRPQGHAELASRVAELLRSHPMIAASLAARHPVTICDEHQDSSGDQHAILMALLGHGSRLRVFADPMQRIFPDKPLRGSNPACDWRGLMASADRSAELDTPHRWTSGCLELGRWVLRAREALKAGGNVDLRTRLPPSVSISFAENQAKRNLEYQLSGVDRRPIDGFERAQSSLLILTRYNDTALSFRSFFNRRLALWEGHTRSELEGLVDAIRIGNGDSAAIASAIVTFMGAVAKGFSPSAFGDAFVKEARGGCTEKRRGKPGTIQDLARFLVEEPDHRGAAKMLRRLWELQSTDAAFGDIKVDRSREFWDAIRLAEFDTVDTALAELAHRRSHARSKPPERSISTIHKAKGLECGSVIIMPCDAKTFPDKADARCLLYVALSRAKSRLMLVLSRSNPSPLLIA